MQMQMQIQIHSSKQLPLPLTQIKQPPTTNLNFYVYIQLPNPIKHRVGSYSYLPTYLPSYRSRQTIQRYIYIYKYKSPSGDPIHKETASSLSSTTNLQTKNLHYFCPEMSQNIYIGIINKKINSLSDIHILRFSFLCYL
ncbi:hypothetical protein EYC80_004030 [Monilinia laxa]|uniref:Uncharacterized protein n=1 Tax=Monilinia laxa TaxID=61186 RepID=A0A5N6KLV7_MONLA|nr:hypothetical protein EYC80_004030 [Monilinia laxa]